MPNFRGRENFFFVQPEVESRGQDIAGASKTIQALMCLAHGMRRRTGREGGFRALAFLDSIDKISRLHAAYDDAETQLRLAAYRTLIKLGRMHGTGWQSDWAIPNTNPVEAQPVQGNDHDNRRVRHDSRGSLRGYPLLKISQDRA